MKIIAIDNLNEIRIEFNATEEEFQAAFDMGKAYWEQGLIHKWNIFIIDEDENIIGYRLPHMFDFEIPEDWIFTLEESIKLYKYEWCKSDKSLYDKLSKDRFKFSYDYINGILQ